MRVVDALNHISLSWRRMWNPCSSRWLQTLITLALFSSFSDNSWSQAAVLPEDFVSTLSQARQDLLSANEPKRVSAAILLGKYAYAESRQLLLSALEDASPTVRRAAAVSLREQATFDSLIDSERFLRKLSDSDVEVRRVVSSIVDFLGKLMNHYSNTATPVPKPYSLPPDLKDIVISALSDEDDIVRLNIVRSFFRLNLLLPASKAVLLLGDSQSKVIIATLQILRSIPMTEDIVEQIEILSKSQDYHMQVALVENLIDSKDERIVKLLKQVTESDESYLRFIHYILKARQGEEITQGEIRSVRNLIAAFKKSTKVLEKLIKEVRLFKSESINEELLSHALLAFRLAGWDIMLKRESTKTDSELLLRGLEDTSPRVRQTIINILLPAPDQIPLGLMENMIASQILDVRIGAAELLVRMPEAPDSKFVLALLVDEAPQVRASALRVMVKHKSANWKKILRRSLRDKDISVQKQSVSQLFSTGQEGVQIIQTYAIENSQTTLAQFINAELLRRNIRPLPNTGLEAR